jgi:hypothetical protein
MGEGYRLTRDIDLEGELDTDKLGRQLARVVDGLALAFQCREDLDDTFRTLMNLLVRAFLGTHRSMRTPFEQRGENAGAIADAMSLAREQIEKMFVVALLLEDPDRWTNAYLRDDWRRRYERFLLERSERSGLGPRRGAPR